MIKKVVFGCIMSFAVFTAPQADQYDTRLTDLFEQLKSTTEPVAARTAEKLIWDIWYQAATPLADNLLMDGTQAMVTHDYATAINKFDELIKINPDFAEAWHKRGTLMMFMQQYSQAKSDLEKALILEPRHFSALTRLGYIYIFEGNERLALDFFRQALAINPYLASVRQTIADLEMKLEDRQL